MKAIRSLFVIASDREFRLLRASGKAMEGVGGGLAKDLTDVEKPFDSEIGRSRKGSIAFENTDRNAREMEDRDRFQRLVAAALEAEWAKGGYDRIVLCAGPKALGALRDALPKALAPHVVAELDKDLVKVPLHDLPDHFRDLPGM